jgi:hypothetical protein
MKKIILVLLGCAGLTVNVFAADSFAGSASNTVQSSHQEINKSPASFTDLLSIRQLKHYGLELKDGIFGKAGLLSANGKIDLSAAGEAAMDNSKFNSNDRADTATDVSPTSSDENVNNPSLTYDAGVEYRQSNGALHLGFQHFYAGNKMLSPSLSSNMIGVSFLVK